MCILSAMVVRVDTLDIELPQSILDNAVHYSHGSRNSARIFNFNEANIVVDLVKTQMERLRRGCVFTWKHPIPQNERIKICLLDIVSWNLHIQHILSDKYYIVYSHVMCFTETLTNDSSFQIIEEYHLDWKSIYHLSADHGLAICYNIKEVVLRKNFRKRHLLSRFYF